VNFEEHDMKPPHRREFLHLAAGAAALSALSRSASAQTYPARPVRLLVAFPSGTPPDAVFRVMAQRLSDRLGQQFVVENRPGAATNIALQAAIASPPDGYTLAHINSSTAVNATLYDKLPFDFLRDTAPVAGVVNFPHLIVVHPSVRANTVPEFIAYAKSNPGKISVASYGTGTLSHLAGELFKSMTGVDMVHVPYRGDPQALPDLMSNRVQAYIVAISSVMPHIRSGALRALAVTGRARYAALPDVPTVGEFVPGFEVSSVTGVGVRNGTPSEIIAKLNAEINAGLADPTIKARLEEMDATPLVLAPAAFGAVMAAEKEKWAKIVKSLGIRAD
jgi:tripartite-type tricarboxylate transporter receptor subunit TctC